MPNLNTAYVLHQRPYRETSVIVHLLCDDDQLVQAVCKGVRGSSKSSALLRISLQPFMPASVELAGKSDLKSLRKIEALSQPRQLQQKALFSAFYINELIVRISRSEGVASGIFLKYEEAIAALEDISKRVAANEASKEQMNMYIEAGLRRFELSYMRLLGYGVDFAYCVDTANSVEANSYYSFDSFIGFSLKAEGISSAGELTNVAGRTITSAAEQTFDKSLNYIPGDILLAIANDRFEDLAVLRYAKLICRELLKPMLGGKPLRSRELFS